MNPTLAALDWDALDKTIQANGLTIDRPRFSVHPQFPEIVYPMDYGYVNRTVGLDGQEIDVFIGTAGTGLVGACFTTDRRKGDQEVKLLYDCDAAEVYMVHGFLNFAPALMSGELRLRTDMATLWRAAPPGGGVDHVEIQVSALARSGPFYTALLKHLGYRAYQVWEGGLSFRKGSLYVVVSEMNQAARETTPQARRTGVSHFAFSASSRDDVDAFCREFLAPAQITPQQGGAIVDATGNYAVSFEDPDRIRLEVVCRLDTQRPPVV